MTYYRCLLVVSSLVLSTVHATHFSKRAEEWDSHCPSWHIGRFQNVKHYFTIGVKGTTRFGFDYEIPITRTETDLIHCSLDIKTYQKSNFCQDYVLFAKPRPFLLYRNLPPDPLLTNYFRDLEEQLHAYYLYVLDWLLLEKPSYINTGHMLEYLARLYLQEITSTYSHNRYFITGGVTYYDFKGAKMKGELDIVVYDRKSCEVVAIGESKASSKKTVYSALSKARKQLKRIATFITANSDHQSSDR